jgi:hypothetical protein
LDLTADHGVTRDNVLFGRVSKGPGRGEGLQFSFKFKGGGRMQQAEGEVMGLGRRSE